MIAWATGTPELALDEEKEEHVILTRAVANVARHYGITVPSGKVVDWANLLKCLSVIYGPRIGAIALRHRAERAKNVTPVKKETPQPAPQAAQQTPQSGRARVIIGADAKGNPIYQDVDAGQLQ